MKKNKNLLKKICLLFTSLILVVPTLTYAENDEVNDASGQSIMIEEDFINYVVDDNITTADLTSKNYGTGFNGSWKNTGNWVYYSGWPGYVINEYQRTLTRNLADPIGFSEDGEYDISLTLWNQKNNFSTFGGLSLLDASNGTVLAIGEYDNVDGSALTRRIITPGKTANSDVTRVAGNTNINIIAKVIINSNGEDTIKMKLYNVGDAEPEDWDLETTAELDGKEASKIKLTNCAVGGWRSLRISTDNIVYNKKVIDSKSGEYKIIDLENAYKIDRIDKSKLMGNPILYGLKTEQITENLKELPDDDYYRYILVKNDNDDLGALKLYGTYKPEFIAPPVTYDENDKRICNEKISSSNEILKIKFDDEAVEPTAAMKINGENVDITTSYENNVLTLVTNTVLKGKCELTVNSQSLQEPYVKEFDADDDIQIKDGKIFNNSDINCSFFDYDSETQISVAAGEDTQYTGSLLLNSDITKMQPASVFSKTHNAVTLDDSFTVNKEENTVTVSGMVKGSDNQPIKGRKVVLAILLVDKTVSKENIIIINATISKDDGKFSEVIDLDPDKNGFFKVLAGTEYSAAPAEAGFYYISKDGAEDIEKKFADADTLLLMETAINDNLSALGINSEKYPNIDTLIEMIAPELLNEEMNTVEEIANKIRSKLVVAQIKQSSSKEAAKDIIEEKYADFGGENNAFEKLTDDMKMLVAENIFNSKTDISSEKILLQLYNAFIEEQLQILNPLTVLSVTSENVSANVGESIIVKINTNNASINDLNISLKYNAQDLKYEKYSYYGAIPYVVNGGDGIITIDIPKISNEHLYTLENGKTIMITLEPLKATTFNTQITGEYKSSIYDSVLELERKYNSDLKIDVSVIKEISNGSSSGGSGGGGGGGTYTGDKTGSYTPTGSVKKEDDSQEETKKESEDLFDDLDSCDWAREAVNYLAKYEIINGVGENKFEPQRQITREEFAKILVLSFNLFDEEATCEFSDIDKSDLFYQYVASGVENEILSGLGNGYFGKGEGLTREQMAVMLYRTIKKFAPYVEADKTTTFSDETEISDWAVEAIDNMTAFGAVKGVGDNLFAPKTTATRAQAATIIYNVLKLFDESIGR